jgi:hypothetical protein
MHIYWIHRIDHTDIFSQGYIGISDKPLERFEQHKSKTNKHLSNAFLKYKDDIKIDILLESSEKYCKHLEQLLRPTENIGWNIAIGGGKPPPADAERNKRISLIRKPYSEESKIKRWETRKNNGTDKGYNYDSSNRVGVKRGKYKKRTAEQLLIMSEAAKKSAKKGWETRRSKTKK